MRIHFIVRIFTCSSYIYIHTYCSSLVVYTEELFPNLSWFHLWFRIIAPLILVSLRVVLAVIELWRKINWSNCVQWIPWELTYPRYPLPRHLWRFSFSHGIWPHSLGRYLPPFQPHESSPLRVRLQHRVSSTVGCSIHCGLRHWAVAVWVESNKSIGFDPKGNNDRNNLNSPNSLQKSAETMDKANGGNERTWFTYPDLPSIEQE